MTSVNSQPLPSGAHSHTTCWDSINCQLPNAVNEDPTYGSCQICDTAKTQMAWTNAPDRTTCGSNLACLRGTCVKAFRKVFEKQNDYLYDLWGSSASDVWAVGGSVPRRSSDGGKTWTDTNPLPGLAFRLGVWGSGPDSVFVVGADGSILKTTDAGMTWTTLPSPTTGPLGGIWGSGANDIYVVGAGGLIARSTDGGISWATKAAGTSNDLFGVWGDSANNVFVVGDGVILRSQDMGTTWAKTAVTAGPLKSIRGVAANDYYAVGYSGMIPKAYRSTDGATWTELKVPTGNVRLYDVWGSAASDVYVAADWGIYRTTDSGKSWQELSVPVSTRFRAVWGSSANDIYAGGEFGFVSTILHAP